MDQGRAHPLTGEAPNQPLAWLRRRWGKAAAPRGCRGVCNHRHLRARGFLIRPNFLILITDQQRYRRHWPDDPGWLRELAPNDAELARSGLSFRNAFCNTAMCSPGASRGG